MDSPFWFDLIDEGLYMVYIGGHRLHFYARTERGARKSQIIQGFWRNKLLDPLEKIDPLQNFWTPLESWKI